MLNGKVFYNNMHQNIEILYFHNRLTKLEAKEDKQKFLHSVSKHDRDKIVQFWRRIILKGHHDEQAQHATHVVKEILIEFSASEHYLEDIKVDEINAIAEFMQKTKKFQDCVNIIDILYLERGIHIFTEGERLFKALVQNFEHLQNDDVREMVTENLIEFMRENKKYIRIANEPYYFMEYLLHIINQEEDPEKIVYWFDTILSLYIHPGSEQHLFYENDFRILIDILVRHIENYRNEKDLTKFIETYLVLSISPFIVKDHQNYKLDHIIIVLNDIPNPSEAIIGYKQQLYALQQQKV